MIVAFKMAHLLGKGQHVTLTNSSAVREVREGERPIGHVVEVSQDGQHALVRLFDPMPCANVYQPPPLRRVLVEMCCHHCGGERWVRSEGQPTACYYCGTERRTS